MNSDITGAARRQCQWQSIQGFHSVVHGLNVGHDKMRSGADLRGGTPLVSFNHVIDPHCVTFSSSLYKKYNNPQPYPKPQP